MERLTRPLAIDLCCGLGGWAEGLLAAGWDVVGFDITRHDYGDGVYPGQLVIQDILTLHGRQFRNASLFVASPPCQEYSYRAMCWKRAKAQIPKGPPSRWPKWWKKPEKEMSRRALAAWKKWRIEHPLPPPNNALFDACFRIQREACEAAGRHIPMVLENVRGAQPWVGDAVWHYGSYFLWGDIPALMPTTLPRRKSKKGSWDLSRANYNPDHSWEGGTKEAGNFHDDGSPKWLREDEGLKVPGVPSWSDYGKPGYVGKGFNVTAAQIERQLRTKRSEELVLPPELLTPERIKEGELFWDAVAEVTDEFKVTNRINQRDGHDHTRHLTNPMEHQKNTGGSWFPVAHNTGSGHDNNPVKALDGIKNQREWFNSQNHDDTGVKVSGDWFNKDQRSPSRLYNSKSDKRKAAAARIAKIPLPLSRHIARTFYPTLLPERIPLCPSIDPS